MASKTVKLNPEYRGFSLSWETTNKKNQKHLMRHFLDISSPLEILNIAEALGWERQQGHTKDQRVCDAREFLTTSLETSQSQDVECEIEIKHLPLKYKRFVNRVMRSTDPFPPKK